MQGFLTSDPFFSYLNKTIQILFLLCLTLVKYILSMLPKFQIYWHKVYNIISQYSLIIFYISGISLVLPSSPLSLMLFIQACFLLDQSCWRSIVPGLQNIFGFVNFSTELFSISLMFVLYYFPLYLFSFISVFF